MGYHQAGFDVIGIDIAWQPNYPFDFFQCDAMVVLRDELWLRTMDFDVIHASPPCQRWLGVPGALGADEYPDLVGPTRELLTTIGLPYVIENVPDAPVDGFILCGSTFGLPLVRHRRFEVRPEIGLAPSACHQGSFGRATDHPGTYPFAHGAWRPAWRKHVIPSVWRWMTVEESHDAIPPAYTEWIGTQLLDHIQRAGCAA